MLMERGVILLPSLPDNNQVASLCFLTNLCLSFLTFLFFPGSETPGQPAIRTGYTCEGDELVVACDAEQTIQIVRANYGRFSIAICNDDGKTHWSVNCMSPKTRHILQNK